MKNYLPQMIEIAKQAGDFLHNHFGKIGTIERKADKSLVTNLDREAEQMILSSLKSLDTTIGILAEETVPGNLDEDYLWVIDPLDGTHNFIRGLTMYGVSIGLAFRKQPVAGVIYMPETDELYVAEKGSGAFKNSVRIHTSERTDLEECTLLFDSSFQTRNEMRVEALGILSPNFFNLRMLGASTRNLTYLAEGKADALVEFDEKPWDFAAGSIIVSEAGGAVTRFDGHPVSIADTRYIGSNGSIHKHLLKLIDPFNRRILAELI